MRRPSELVFAMTLISIACTSEREPTPDPVRHVTVRGSATLTAPPDRVEFSAGVGTSDTSPASAFKSNNAKMVSLIAALKQNGVTDPQMQTSYFDVDREYASRNASRRFRVVNHVTVTHHDPAEIAKLIEVAIAAGANEISGVRFSIGDSLDFEKRGLEQAVESARAKAEHLAREVGAELGEVISISDGTSYPENDSWGALRSLGYADEASIQKGTSENRFSVTVVFALR